MNGQQFHLWREPDTVKAEKCERCGIGLVVVTRTNNPYEDVERCRECHYTICVSHSREFGQRYKEVTGT